MLYIYNKKLYVYWLNELFSAYNKYFYFCCSVTKSRPTLCNPMDCSMPGSSVLHYNPECAQIHVHWVSAIETSHPLPPPPLFSFNLSQHQDLFQWISSLHQEAKILGLPSASVLPMNIQGWFPLELTGLNSLQYKGLSRVFSGTTIQKHQFFGA